MFENWVQHKLEQQYPQLDPSEYQLLMDIYDGEACGQCGKKYCYCDEIEENANLSSLS